jgi:hypothetical protein
MLGSEHYPPKVLLDQRDSQSPQNQPGVGRVSQDLNVEMPSGLSGTGSGYLAVRSEHLGEHILNVIAVKLVGQRATSDDLDEHACDPTQFRMSSGMRGRRQACSAE